MFSANSSQVSGDRLFVEDVFSTYLYTGNGASSQTITNGIDLSGKGGMVWIKSRNVTGANDVWDTSRGANNLLVTNETDGQGSGWASSFGFGSSGFSLTGSDGSTYSPNRSGVPYASWTFREAPKFFDVVTYTGNGANRNIAHNLGSVPGMILVKRTNTAGDWQVYHRSNANTQYMVLNNTSNVVTGTTRWNSTTPTATEFTVGTDNSVNNNGSTYVAYLFAHDTSSTGIIQCGSFTTSSGVSGLVNVGFEPQWVLIKRTDSSTLGDWQIYDNMRGVVASNNGGTYAQPSQILQPNTSAAEATEGYGLGIYQQGFNFNNASGTSTYIYVAIRRGPMRTPTLGTSVFAPVLASSSDTAGTTFTTNFPVDMQATRLRIGDSTFFTDRLRGVSSTSAETGPSLRSNTTDAESTTSPAPIPRNWNNTGFQLSSSLAGFNMVNWNFRRAPGFFDEVCYTGTGAAITIPHNLGVVPELIIQKRRNGADSWYVFAAQNGFGTLNATSAWGGLGNGSGTNTIWQATASSVALNSTFAPSFAASGSTYVAYLFASCAGVSKVGSYTGTGALQTINCGFAAGARFVLIKRTDSTGDWFVWDSARGISSGNDPYLLLNNTAGETTSTNYVDTDATGFKVTAAAPAGINASGGSYLFLAIA